MTNTHNLGVHFTSQKQTWKTPKEFYSKLNAEFHFNFDPCPPNPKFDGLAIEWGKRSFVNPPYSEVKKWVEKAWTEAQKGKLVVMLTASRTDTKWFHEIVLPYAKEIRFIKGRLKFDDYENSAPFPSVIIVFST